MELVTLIDVTFNRIGSASGGGGFSSQRQLQKIGEVANEEPETLREFIIATAEADGESIGALAELRLDQSYGRGRGEFVFNIQGRNTFYGSPYAVCKAYPALKIAERYFKLEEIKV